MSDAFWYGFFVLVTMIVKEYFDRRRAAVVEKKIDEVHIATNGLTKRLETAAGNAGFQAGELGAANPTKQ